MKSKLTSHLIIFISFISFTPWYSKSVKAEGSSPRISVLVGPPAYGSGDSNPITFQNPIEYEYQGLAFKTLEFRASGLGAFLGYRATSSYRAYASVGLGITYTPPGVGGNIYFSVGHDLFCKGVCFTAEVMNALGITKGGYFVGLFRLQMGISYIF